MKWAYAFTGACALGALAVAAEDGLEIQVAPRMLVISSGGDNVTVHTSFSGYPAEGTLVALDITAVGGEPQIVPIVEDFLDDCGFYVVRCDRQEAALAVGAFDGKRTTATVTLTIGDAWGAQEITVQK